MKIVSAVYSLLGSRNVIPPPDCDVEPPVFVTLSPWKHRIRPELAGGEVQPLGEANDSGKTVESGIKRQNLLDAVVLHDS
jgi:hypothetical protein